MKVAVPFALAVLIALGVMVPLLIGGLRDEIVILGLLGPAAIGAQVGWSTRARVPTWLFVALAVAGIVLVLVGLTRYDDEGDSGPLFWALLALGAIALPPRRWWAGSPQGRPSAESATSCTAVASLRRRAPRSDLFAHRRPRAGSGRLRVRRQSLDPEEGAAQHRPSGR